MRQRAGAQRSLCDDEVLLLRTRAVLLIAAGDVIPAIAYLLTESGLYPRELSSVTFTSFTPDYRQVQSVGVTKIAEPRTVPLPMWVINQLTPLLAELAETNDTTPLCYRPRKRKPGSLSAGASASGNLRRFMIAAGLPADDPGLKPESILRWRAKTENQGPLMYGHPTGGSTQTALDLIGMIDNKMHTADERLASFLGEPLKAGKRVPKRGSDCFDNVRV